MKQISRQYYLSFLANLYNEQAKGSPQYILISDLDNTKIRLIRQNGLWWPYDRIELVGQVVEENYTNLTPYETSNGRVVGFKVLRPDLQALIEEDIIQGLTRVHLEAMPNERGIFKRYSMAYSNELLERVNFPIWPDIWKRMAREIDNYENTTTIHP